MQVEYRSANVGKRVKVQRKEKLKWSRFAPDRAESSINLR
jgi:hypothetical protein